MVIFQLAIFSFQARGVGVTHLLLFSPFVLRLCFIGLLRGGSLIFPEVPQSSQTESLKKNPGTPLPLGSTLKKPRQGH